MKFEFKKDDKLNHPYLGEIKILDRRYSDSQGIQYLIQHSNPTKMESAWGSKGMSNYKACVTEGFLMRIK